MREQIYLRCFGLNIFFSHNIYPTLFFPQYLPNAFFPTIFTQRLFPTIFTQRSFSHNIYPTLFKNHYFVRSLDKRICVKQFCYFFFSSNPRCLSFFHWIVCITFDLSDEPCFFSRIITLRLSAHTYNSMFCFKVFP